MKTLAPETRANRRLQGSQSNQRAVLGVGGGPVSLMATCLRLAELAFTRCDFRL